MAWTDFMKGLLREDANFDILGNQRTNNRDERRASDSSLMLAAGRGVRQKRASLGYELHTGNLIGSQCFKRPAQSGRGVPQVARGPTELAEFRGVWFPNLFPNNRTLTGCHVGDWMPFLRRRARGCDPSSAVEIRTCRRAPTRMGRPVGRPLNLSEVAAPLRGLACQPSGRRRARWR